MMTANFRRGWRWLPVASVVLPLTWAVSSAFGQGGIILPGLGANATNLDRTETTGTPSAIVTIADGIVPQPGGAMGIEDVDNLVNNITAGDPADNQAKWLDFQGATIMMPVHIQLAAPAAMKFYTLTSANDAPERDPYEWRVLGTNVVNPTIGDFTLLDSRTAVEFSARDQTQLFGQLVNTTAYTTYRFEFETELVAGGPAPGAPNSIQLAEVEIFDSFAFAGPLLTINRSTGAMTLTNGSGSPINMTGYSIISPRGALNSNAWLSITNNYDGNDGAEVDTDNWIRLTAANGRKDLSEVENPNGTNGAVLAPSQAINLGTSWLKNTVEDVTAEILLANGTTQNVTISFEGGTGLPWVFGDLNFSGGAAPINAADWNTFKTGQGFNFSTVFSAAESYSRGDLDGDLDFDLDDFGIFKATFDAANGAGAFVEMLASIPEPGTGLLFVVSALSAVTLRLRRLPAVLVMICLTSFLVNGSAACAGEVIPGLIGSDLTDPDNVAPLDVVITAGDQANSPENEAPSFALDNNGATKWLAFQPNGTFYQMQFNGGAQHAVNTYTLTSANDAPERDPFRWNLMGSNDGVNFTLVDHQSTQRFTARGQTQQFVVANTQTYNHYRFDFLTALGAGALGAGAPNSIQLGEIELFDDPNPDILTLEVNTQTNSIRFANNSDDTVPFDAYRIKSPSGALNFANWSGGPLISNNGGQSIHDLNLPGFPRGNGTGNGWEEGLAGSSNFDLTEYYLGTGGVGSSSLGSEQGITMNNVFQPGGAHDLTFEYRSNGQNVRGFVTYTGAAVPGDYNNNGSVDAADYVLWRNGGPLQNDPTPGVQAADYTFWRSRFGLTSGGGSSLSNAAAIPEPASWVLIGLVPGLLLSARRRSTKDPIASKFARIMPRAYGDCAAPESATNRCIVTLAGMLAACLLLVNTAPASTLDRDYRFQGNGQDSAPPADDLTASGGPTFVNVQALGRPGATAGDMGVQLSAASSQFLSAFGLGSPPEGAPIGVTYPESRLMQVWVRPTVDTGARQEVVSDTFQFGIFITATDTWGHTYGSDVAPVELGDDFATTAPVTYNAWTHIMQRTFENDGVVLYVNGVAVSRFQADYEVSTLAITPTPNRDIFVGAGSGGTTNFFTGQLDNLEIAVAGAVMGGTDFGPVNLAIDNDYIAFALSNMGFVNGDVNGDGVVNGTGTGPAATDDVRFFIDHWLAEQRVNNILVGDLVSRTTLGDLNFDGRTSLADWQILRSIHAGGGSLDLAALLGGVPEPSTLALTCASLILIGGLIRRKRDS